MSRKLFVGLLVTLMIVGLGVSIAMAADPGEEVCIPSYLADMMGLEVIPFEDTDGKPVIGFSQCTLNHPWRVAMVDNNVNWVKENWPEAELIVTDGQNTSTKQVADVDDLLAREVDILVISPLQADPLTPAVKKAMEEGVPVVVLDRDVNTEKSAFMGGDNIEIGEAAAAFVCDRLGGEGKVIEIQGTAGASATIDRKAGFEQGLAACPGVELVASQTADYLREPAINFMEDMLQKYGPGEIDAVYAHNDEMALGAIKAVKAAGRLDEIMVVGIDGQNEAIEAIKAGDLAATFTYHYCAPEGLMYAKAIYDGVPINPDLTLRTAQIDAENVDEFLGKGF